MNANTYRTKLTRNMQSRVAKQIHVTRGHVSLVANGHRTSAKVERALAKEYARIEREVLRFQRGMMERAA